MSEKSVRWHLLYRLADGSLRAFELPLMAALLAEIAFIEQLIPDLFEREATSGGVCHPPRQPGEDRRRSPDRPGTLRAL